MAEDKIYCESGGCTAKLGAGVLTRVLERMPKGPQDPNLLVGYDGHDDAAVYRISDDLALVQTLDFFPPMVEDPYLFGQIAATNALSDIYAMGGEVKTALNIVCFPESMDLNILGKIMEGGSSKVIESGGSLAGGHSINDAGIKYGLSVTGLVSPSKMWTNDGCLEGDVLLFTKKLGTGIICAANRVGEAPEGALEQAICSMTTLNRTASEVARRFNIHACTDVTGFGFLGHLLEMLGVERDKPLTCDLYTTQIPVLPGALDCAENFLTTGGGQKNRNYVGDRVSFAPAVSFGMQEVLFDPQTAGGLLFAVSKEEAKPLQKALLEAGSGAAIVGQVTKPVGPGEAMIRVS